MNPLVSDTATRGLEAQSKQNPALDSDRKQTTLGPQNPQSPTENPSNLKLLVNAEKSLNPAGGNTLGFVTPSTQNLGVIMNSILNNACPDTQTPNQQHGTILNQPTTTTQALTPPPLPFNPLNYNPFREALALPLWLPGSNSLTPWVMLHNPNLTNHYKPPSWTEWKPF